MYNYVFSCDKIYFHWDLQLVGVVIATHSQCVCELLLVTVCIWGCFLILTLLSATLLRFSVWLCKPEVPIIIM